MYTKKDLCNLRELLIEKRSKYPSDFSSGWATFDYIYNSLMIYNEPEDFKNSITSSAERVKDIYVSPEEIDYVLAYNLLFGDISIVPLHLNDIFEIISIWRLKNPNSPVDNLCTQKIK